MNICIPIKQVPEPEKTRMDEATGRIIRDGVKSVVNPLDLFAIEAGIRLRELHGGEVTVISMGPPSAVEAIREALAMGCDRGWLVSDAAFAGSDTWATSYILSNAVRHIGLPDLLICGERAIDGETGQVGPGIAAFLGLPLVPYASGLELRDGGAVVTRLAEDRYETWSCSFPLAVTVVKEISNPRLPTLAGKKRAKNARVPVLSGRDLELDAGSIGTRGSPTKVKKIHRPVLKREGEVIVVKKPADVALAVERLLSCLESDTLRRMR